MRPARRSLVIFTLLALGVVLGRVLPEGPAPAWFAVACLGCAIGALTRGWACRGCLSVACIAFAVGWWTLQVPMRGGSTLDVALEAHRPRGQRRIVEVEGVALGSARVVEAGGSLARFMPGEASASFELAVERVRAKGAWRASRGRVRVFGEGLAVRGGQRVRVLGLHTPTRPAMNPGEVATGLWSATRRDAGSLRVTGGTLLSEAHEQRSASEIMLSLRSRLRDRARGVLDRENSVGGTLLRAITLGVHDPQRREVRDAFTRVGFAHLMAISGFHLALLVGLVLLAMRMTGDWGRLEAAVLIVLVLGYLVIVPARPPIVRAGLVVLAIVLSESRGRRYDRLSVLAWVGVALLLWRPMDLFTLGFQLSLGLTGALLWLAPKVERRLRPARIRGLIERPDPRLSRAILPALGARVRSAFVVTLVCWLIALPVVIHHTGLVSPMAILTTLLVTPVILLILALGFSGVVIGLAWPAFGAMLAALGARVGDGLAWSVRALDEIPVSSFGLPGVSLVWAALGVGLAIAWLRLGMARWRVLLAGTALALAWLGLEVRASSVDRDVALRVDILSVGDGTCFVLRSGDEAMLWDCGSSRPAFGERELGRIVRALGAWEVPRVIITHPNLDHHNGLVDAIEPLGVREVLVNDAFLRRGELRHAGAEAYILAELAERGVGVRVLGAGDTLALGEVTLDVLSPSAGWTAADINDSSLVALVRVATRAGERRLLLTGDIEREAMARLLASGNDIGADAMELPHHGSHHPTAERFVEAVDPALVMQSTGPTRLHDERWERARLGRDWLVTARDGAITLIIHADGRVESRTFSGR